MKATLEVLDEKTVASCVCREEQNGFGAVETARGRLPLKAMDLSGRITGLSYRNCLTQTFVNAYSEPLEATYIFPLPDRAAVVQFRMKIEDRVIEGVLKERGQARAEYDAAIQQGHRAAIAEEERPDVFTMRAGNIPPGEAITVELELSGPLSFADGEATYRFPLVVAPRYIPGIPLDGPSVGSGVAVDTDAVPDASRITPPILLPGQPNPVRFTLALELDPSGLPVGELRSSLHEMVVEERPGGVRSVALRPGVERLNRDFILRFKVGEGAVVSGLTAVRDEVGPGSTFSLTVVPPTLQECGVQPRDVVVVLDRSGSMSGWKMVAARRAAARLIDTLTPQDRFAVILFDSVLEEPIETAGRLVEATDRARFQAVEFLARVEARGGTEIGPALVRSLDYLRPKNGPEKRERVIVFVTDGQVGNESQLLAHVQKHAQGVRIFSIGIDRSVCEAFLRGMAQQTGGTFELVESEDRLDTVLRNVHRRIGSPVLQDVRVQLPGQVDAERTPYQADVFPGVPAIISGRTSQELPARVLIEARRPDGSLYREEVPVTAGADPVVRHIWARARVRDMEQVLDSGHYELGEAITQFSLKWGVLCRFTAYVAVDRSEVVNPSGRVREVTQAVEPAEGWAMLEAECRALPSLEAPAPQAWLGGTNYLVCDAAPPARPESVCHLERPVSKLKAESPPRHPGPARPGATPPAPPRKQVGPPDGATAPRKRKSFLESVLGPAQRSSEPPAEMVDSFVEASPLKQLKRRLPELEEALKRVRKDPADAEAARLLDELLRSVLASIPELEAGARDVLQAIQAGDASAATKLDAWLDQAYRATGTSRRKSWWKR